MLRTMRSGLVSNPRTAAMTLDRCSLVNLSIVVPLGFEAAHLARRCTTNESRRDRFDLSCAHPLEPSSSA
jgi:hypothetical protein